MFGMNYQLTDLSNEVWKDISGYENIYQISNLGRVKSLKRELKNQHGKSNIIMKQRKNRDGYLRVNLKKDNKMKIVNIHRLVAIHFIENITQLPVVNHIDGDKNNNTANNLIWCTAQENTIHAFKNGLTSINKGEKSKSAKLTENDVRNIYQKYFDKKISPSLIAKKYGVSRRCIEKIIRGETWKELAYEYGVLNV